MTACADAGHLRIVFDALDVKNGLLSQKECMKLCTQVLGEEAAEGVADAVFDQMDVAGTGDVSWEAFMAFFNVGGEHETTEESQAAAALGLQKLYGLLADMPLMANLSLAERQALPSLLETVSFKDGDAIMTQACT